MTAVRRTLGALALLAGVVAGGLSLQAAPAEAGAPGEAAASGQVTAWGEVAASGQVTVLGEVAASGQATVPPQVAASARPAPPARTAASGAEIFRIPVTGTIELGLAPFVERSIRQAEAAPSGVVVLDIDTPGGRVDAAQRIVDAIRDSQVPVYAYVNRRAFSAGAMIALATDEIFMLPGAVMGAATPVGGSGETAPEKIVSAMRSEMRGLAEARGLDPRVAEAMVDPEIEVPGVIEAGRLLTLTAGEAVELGFATAVDGWSGFLALAGLEGATVAEMEVNWAERVVRFLSNPIVSPFLLTLGFLGLLAEIKTPGLGIAGGAGLAALALFFGSHLILGLAGWEHVLLFIVGLAFLVAEIFVVPGFGVFGALGVLAILSGVYLALLGNLPTTPDYARAGGIVSTALLMAGVSAWALLRHLPKSARLAESGIFLLTRTERETGYESSAPRPELVGLEGRAATDLRPAGTGVFGDERIDVVSDAGWIEKGAPIRIVTSEGYRHVVRPVGEGEAKAADSGDPGKEEDSGEQEETGE